MTVCPKCGKSIKTGAVFCPYCGKSVGADVPKTTDEGTADKSKNAVDNKAKTIIIAIAAVAILAVIALFVSQSITGKTNRSDSSVADKSEIVSEIQNQKNDNDLNDSYNDDYAGSWTGFGMIGNDEKLISMPDDMMILNINRNGNWSMTVNAEKKLNYDGDWKVEYLSNGETLVFYDEGESVAMGTLNNDRTLGIIFYLADEDTLLLFERD